MEKLEIGAVRMKNATWNEVFEFYRGKRVFVTGHTGFKGSWLIKVLHDAGADVMGYSLEPPTKPSLFEIIGGVILYFGRSET